MLVISALAVTQLSHLRFDISAQSMMVESDPAWLDYQKSLDTFGSDNTDETPMKALTKIISFQMRSVDIFARWSNTQFIVVMPRTTSASSIQFTQRIKQALENNDVENMGRVHMSAAITESIEDEDINPILNRLEDSLNDLKQTGKSLHITTT